LKPEWCFQESPKTAVITTRWVAVVGEWVAYVSHDSEDGFWQFHSQSGFEDERDVVLVSLAEMVNKDSTLMQLAGLPRGWHAWRDSPGALWRREEMGKEAADA